MENKTLPLNVENALQVMFDKMELHGDITIKDCNYYNAGAYEVMVVVNKQKFCFDVNLYEKYICEIKVHSRNRTNFVNF